MQSQQANYQGLSATLVLLLFAALMVAIGAILHRRHVLRGRGPVIAWAIICAIPLAAALLWPLFQPRQTVASPPTAGSDVAH